MSGGREPAEQQPACSLTPEVMKLREKKTQPTK